MCKISKLPAIFSYIILFAYGIAHAQTPQTSSKAGAMIINGDSFFAASNIAVELARLASADGYILPGDSFRQIAVSGAPVNTIINQYINCTPKPELLLTNGGFTDMLLNCRDSVGVNCAVISNLLIKLPRYLEAMRAGGTKKFIWVRHPDPQGTQWTILRENMDVAYPEIEKIFRNSKDPECQWVDLRPVWEGHYSEYTSDGIHCTNAGGAATAAALWKAISESKFFDLTVMQPYDSVDPGFEPKDSGTINGGMHGRINCNDLVINGEAVFAGSNIASELMLLAVADGIIAPGEQFKQIAVSGFNLSQIVNHYKSYNPKPKYLITDGGIIDMMLKCPDPVTADCPIIKKALDTAQQYLAEMKAGGTKKVLWMRYADPQGDQWSPLKSNLDVFMPELEKMCKASKDPEVVWVDLRQVWEGHYPEYATNGFQCTLAGGMATAEAFWKAMKDNNFFNNSSVAVQSAQSIGNARTVRKNSAELPLRISSRNMNGSILFECNREINTVRLTDMAGRVVFAWKGTAKPGRMVSLPGGGMSGGIYLVNVTSGNMSGVARLIIP